MIFGTGQVVLILSAQDIDPNDKKRWCEYLFYRGLVKYVQTNCVYIRVLI